MTAQPPTPSVFDLVPPPEAVVRRLGETAAERRFLRALLKVARLRPQPATPPVPGGRRAVTAVSN